MSNAVLNSTHGFLISHLLLSVTAAGGARPRRPQGADEHVGLVPGTEDPEPE